MSTIGNAYMGVGRAFKAVENEVNRLITDDVITTAPLINRIPMNLYQVQPKAITLGDVSNWSFKAQWFRRDEAESVQGIPIGGKMLPDVVPRAIPRESEIVFNGFLLKDDSRLGAGIQGYTTLKAEDYNAKLKTLLANYNDYLINGTRADNTFGDGATVKAIQKFDGLKVLADANHDVVGKNPCVETITTELTNDIAVAWGIRKKINDLRKFMIGNVEIWANHTGWDYLWRLNHVLNKIATGSLEQNFMGLPIVLAGNNLQGREVIEDYSETVGSETLTFTDIYLVSLDMMYGIGGAMTPVIPMGEQPEQFLRITGAAMGMTIMDKSKYSVKRLKVRVN